MTVSGKLLKTLIQKTAWIQCYCLPIQGEFLMLPINAGLEGKL